MASLYKQVTSEENLRLAIDFTLADFSKDHFFNPIQLAHCRNFKERYLERVTQLLANPKDYMPRTALRMLHKKGEFSYRNFIVQDIEDAIIRTAIARVLADHMEEKLIDNCFASRRGKQIEENKSLTEDFAEFGWNNYCAWQEKCVGHYPLLLITDIASFFDSICHDMLLSVMREEFGLSAKNPLLKLMHNVLKVSHIISEHSTPVKIRHGITIGLQANHIFANLFLNKIDHIMCSLPGIEYGRYVDDMRIFAKHKEALDLALVLLQARLFEQGLNLNGAKTRYAGDQKLLKKLLSDHVFDYDQPDDKKGGQAVPSAIITMANNLQSYHETKGRDIDSRLNQEHPLIDAWKGKRVLGDPKRITAWLHSAQATIDYQPGMFTKSAVNKLFRIICESPKNQKFACWVIMRIVIDKRYSEKDRLGILNRLFDTILLGRTTAYVRMRMLALMFKTGLRYHYNFDLIDSATGTVLRDKFVQVLLDGLEQGALLHKIVSLHALVVYNLLHPDQDPVVVELEKGVYEHPVISENIANLKELAGKKPINKMIRKERKKRRPSVSW